MTENTFREYKSTIGLEIHAELKTKSKMFCSCPNEPFASEPNSNICPICTAQPGVLPYVNFQAVKQVLKVGLALDGKIADFTEFDRKNYFYPDIPKAYQISQYKYPLVSKAFLNGVEITRIHLEEDTATSVHKQNHSLVDFNRAGVPLMELVTEPVIKDAEEARDFAKSLQLLLRALDVSDANLEKGEMRIEANISVSKTEKFGTKVEVKNLNSFKAVHSAILYETQRQIKALEKGEKIIQETHGWDENKQKTFSQRKKESSKDYRYFPDPDIPKYKLSEVSDLDLQELKESLPELPWQKAERYAKDFGIKKEDIDFYLQNPDFDKIFSEASKILQNNEERLLLSNYITSDLSGLYFSADKKEKLENIKASEMAKLVLMIKKGELSSRGAKDLLLLLFQEGGKAKELAEKHSLIQNSDPEKIKEMAQKVLQENEKQAEAYRLGEEKMLKYFVGQVMKESKGTANPQMTEEILKSLLKD